MFNIVGVVGQAGHGKDSVASILVDRYRLRRVALADRLKEDLSGWFDGFEQFTMDRQNARDRDPVVRRLQQIYGTEIRRYQDERYWLKEFAMKALKAATSGVRGVVVSDVRFPNEVKTIKEEWGGKIVFVERPHTEANVDMTHESERHVKDLKSMADIVIINDSDLVELERRVSVSMTDILV